MIQFPKQTHLTLGSVEGWGSGSNGLNILRDPPKGIFTRRIDKVGDTQGILLDMEAAGDRTSENILVYARGVNPCTAVTYDNNGGMGGQSTTGTGSAATQAFLPYTVNRDGAFRPPIQTQYDLLPLSRLPRTATSMKTNVDFPNYAIKAACPSAKNMREIVTNKIKTSIRPTASFNIAQPLKEGFAVKGVIDNPTQFSQNSAVSGHTKYLDNGFDIMPKAHINSKEYTNVGTNLGSRAIQSNGTNNFNTDMYVQDPLYKSVTAGVSANVGAGHQAMNTDGHIQNVTYLDVQGRAGGGGFTRNGENAMENVTLLKNMPGYEASTGMGGGFTRNGENGMENVTLLKNLPEYSTSSGVSRNIHVATEHRDIQLYHSTPATSASTNTSANYHINTGPQNYNRLTEKPQIGGFENQGVNPNRNMRQNIINPNQASKRLAFDNKVNDYHQRFNNF
ncbi:MAG: hypothetical protein JKX76_02105 [Colwellia sp.]|nr:hypothetical protein [Colwellia sp.]